jgi:hypothetical protein
LDAKVCAVQRLKRAAAASDPAWQASASGAGPSEVKPASSSTSGATSGEAPKSEARYMRLSFPRELETTQHSRPLKHAAAAGEPARQASGSGAGPSEDKPAFPPPSGGASGEVTDSEAGGAVPQSVEEAERRRLFVPGLQYHILRRPALGGQSQVEKRQEQEGGEAEGLGDGSEKVRHSVCRGDDVNRRFGRIVLTNTMLADHSCPAYLEGLRDAVRTCTTDEAASDVPLTFSAPSSILT